LPPEPRRGPMRRPPGAVMDPRSAGRSPTACGPRAAPGLSAGHPRRASPCVRRAPCAPAAVPCRCRRFPVTVDPHRPPPDSPLSGTSSPAGPSPDGSADRGCGAGRLPLGQPVARLLPRRGGGTSSTASARPGGRRTLRVVVAGRGRWIPGRCRGAGVRRVRTGSARTSGASCCCRSSMSRPPPAPQPLRAGEEETAVVTSSPAQAGSGHSLRSGKRLKREGSSLKNGSGEG